MEYKILEFASEAEALAKSAEYLSAPEGSLTTERWTVSKHPTQDLWAVAITEGENELSEADAALLKDNWGELPQPEVVEPEVIL